MNKMFQNNYRVIILRCGIFIPDSLFGHVDKKVI